MQAGRVERVVSGRPHVPIFVRTLPKEKKGDVTKDGFEDTSRSSERKKREGTYTEKKTKPRRIRMTMPPKMRKGRIWRGAMCGRSRGGSAVTVTMEAEDDDIILRYWGPSMGVTRLQLAPLFAMEIAGRWES